MSSHSAVVSIYFRHFCSSTVYLLKSFCVLPQLKTHFLLSSVFCQRSLVLIVPSGAGLLMTGLTEEPFNLPFSTLLYGNAHPELEEEGQLAHTHSFSTSLCCVRDRTKAAAEAAAAASASATAATATLMLLEQDQMLSKENQESLARNSNDEDRICSDTITASTTFSGSNSIDENSSCPVPIDEKRLESTTWPNGLACVLGAPARFSLAAVCASCLLVICMASAAVVLCSE